MIIGSPKPGIHEQVPLVKQNTEKSHVQVYSHCRLTAVGDLTASFSRMQNPFDYKENS